MEQLQVEVCLDPERFDPSLSHNLGKEISEQFGESGSRNFQILSRNHDGHVVGGIQGLLHWGWGYIQKVWVDKNYRNRGVLRKMLETLESESQRRDLAGLYIDTFDVSVAEIYQKLGFKKCGEVTNFPKGFAQRIFLSKHLGS